ncbi:hypothetical protein EB796_012785 [Bugula neritina]|uniref:Fibronectin type-III domain-containing protein n=1 Tax=Bugula neritina TaxID=10212 RepID=A0A7J7JU10_BUGNE|nr:hypothetical protein EB796_012785 [Bugula neritina]
MDNLICLQHSAKILVKWEPPYPEAPVDLYTIYYSTNKLAAQSEWVSAAVTESSLVSRVRIHPPTYFRVNAINSISQSPLSNTVMFFYQGDAGPSVQIDQVEPAVVINAETIMVEKETATVDTGTATVDRDAPTVAGNGTTLVINKYTSETATREPSFATDNSMELRDGVTTATDSHRSNCPHQELCHVSQWGCCSDGVTAAAGPGLLGCAGDAQPCDISEHECCPDGLTPAAGPNFLGCDSRLERAVNCQVTLARAPTTLSTGTMMSLVVVVEGSGMVVVEETPTDTFPMSTARQSVWILLGWVFVSYLLYLVAAVISPPDGTLTAKQDVANSSNMVDVLGTITTSELSVTVSCSVV